MSTVVSRQSSLSSSTVETCPICLDEFVDVESGSVKEQLSVTHCAHAFCRDCMQDYCQICIVQQRVPIPCPRACSSDACTEVLSDELVRAAIHSTKSPQPEDENASTHWKNYQRLSRLLDDPTLLTCPQCGDLVRPDNILLGLVHCNSCSHGFCPEHGDAHLGIPCARYKKSKAARDIRKSEATLRKWTKPCSHCGIPIQKASGCDHVRCSACDGDMCFKCGTHQYLSGKMVRICSYCNQGYLDHRYMIWHRLYTCCFMLPLWLPFALCWMVITSVLVIITGGFLCCFGCGRCISGAKGRPQEAFRTGLIVVCWPLMVLCEEFGIPFCISLNSINLDAGSKEIEILEEKAEESEEENSKSP